MFIFNPISINIIYDVPIDLLELSVFEDDFFFMFYDEFNEQIFESFIKVKYYII